MDENLNKFADNCKQDDSEDQMEDSERKRRRASKLFAEVLASSLDRIAALGSNATESEYRIAVSLDDSLSLDDLMSESTESWEEKNGRFKRWL